MFDAQLSKIYSSLDDNLRGISEHRGNNFRIVSLERLFPASNQPQQLVF